MKHFIRCTDSVLSLSRFCVSDVWDRLAVTMIGRIMIGGTMISGVMSDSIMISDDR